MTDDLSPQLIGGRYETVRPIGRGGMGTVWLARDTVLGRQVAAKQIGAFPGESEGETRRAMREARAAAALNHPNVVAVYDVTEHEGTPWLVMEYVAGPTLASAVRERGPMTPRGAADLGAQLAGALAAAHRAGIVHRDIKPANILIGGGRPKIGDFGIARSGAEDQLTQTGLVTGTPSYMAPEVAIGDEHGEAADVWALGATIYYAVEGRDAHTGQGNALATLRYIATHPPRRPERAGALEPVLADMLSRDQARRGTMAQALRRLENVAAGGSGGAADAPTAVHRPTSAPPSAVPPSAPQETKRRSPLLLWSLLALLVAAVVAVGVAVAVNLDDGSQSPGGDTSVTGGEVDPPPASEPPATTTPETTTTTPESSTTSEEEPEISEDEARTFIEDYFATVTQDREAAWEMLAPSRQTDRDGYDEFWSDIDSVDTKDITLDEDAGTVDVTLTYHPKDRDASSESQSYQLTRIDGDLRITD